MLLLMWFGTIDVAIWAFLSALLAGIIHFLSIDFIASFLELKKLSIININYKNIKRFL